MTDDLVAFLRARLDDDEQAARRACQYASPEWHLDEEFGETVLWWPPEPRVAEEERCRGLPVISDRWRGQTIESTGPDIAPHIARHDPARVLAEVDAKRRIMDEIAPEATALDETVDYSRRAEPRDLTREPYLGDLLLRHLALPFAGHPDFREEWRP